MYVSEQNGNGDFNQQLVLGAQPQVAVMLSTYLALSKKYVACRDVILQRTYVSETPFFF